VRVAERRLTVCLLIQEWPPVSLNGIARVVLTLARGLAGTGHVVHVLTRGDGHDRVDLEDGVWVHRICTRSHPAPRGIDVPARIWDYSATLLDELERIDAHRRVDVVQFPNWDSEGIAALLTGRYRTVLGLYTPLRATRAVDPVLGAPSRELDQLEEVEKFCYLHADRLLACGPAIVHDIEERYRIVLDPGRLGYVAHAIEDAPSVVVPAGDPDHPEVLFVGRLEPRKGIDTLLECIPRLAARHPGAHFTIAGRDAHPWPDGRTVRQRFESSPQGRGLGDRVTFTGVLPDGELLRAYAGCDILVAPSRFESFGLILLEAMRFGKPVVACAVGGMTDIVEDGGNGLLVPPGEAGALEAALSRLLLSETLRAAYGARSRQLFVERYSIERMVSGVSREYDLASGRSTAGAIPGSLERPQTTVGGAEAPAGEGGGGAGAPSSAPLPAEPPAAAVPSIGDAHSRILDRLVCPTCHATPGIRARVVATDGRVRSGQVVCDTCGMVATVHGGKVDFLPEPAEPLAAGPPRAVAPPGELRLTARCPGVELTGIWHPESQGWVRSDGDPTDAIRYRGRFTDAVVRLLRHPYSGIADLYLDDSLVDSVDLFQDAGSTVVGFTIAEDIDFAPHTISVRPRGAAGPGSKGSQVIFEELVLGGPPGVEEFREPVPINRGNPYSAVIERCISECSPSGLILEVGGGDRRRVDSRHLNVEFLKFELADLYADIHHLPFADGTFELVFSQAVFEHVAHPFEAAQELIRVTRPGGTILTEVAFMQPLHAVPYHYFNMTPWGAEELFRSCEILETDWFGDLSFTVDWLMRSVNLDRKVGSRRMRKLAAQFVKMDALVSHEELRPAASGVYVIARKPG
jgi:glycosyltransferase involved in cell wall biosynthesis/SAM-dependent methyltransferase